jgi:putative ABC transport system ATP-binding protein
VNDPAVILADEPTGNLDSKNTEEIMKLFTRLNRETGISIVMVTHESDVAEFSDRKVLFKDGEIIDDSPVRRKKNIKISKRKM